MSITLLVRLGPKTRYSLNEAKGPDLSSVLYCLSDALGLVGSEKKSDLVSSRRKKISYQLVAFSLDLSLAVEQKQWSLTGPEQSFLPASGLLIFMTCSCLIHLRVRSLNHLLISVASTLSHSSFKRPLILLSKQVDGCKDV